MPFQWEGYRDTVLRRWQVLPLFFLQSTLLGNRFPLKIKRFTYTPTANNLCHLDWWKSTSKWFWFWRYYCREMASSRSRLRTFPPIFSKNKLYCMEYSVADTSEVQWVSSVLLQFFTVVYAWNNTYLKKQRLTKWYAAKGVSNLLWLWRKRHEEILKHKSSIPESSIKIKDDSKNRNNVRILENLRIRYILEAIKSICKTVSNTYSKILAK